MATPQQRRVIGAAMVALGLVQAGMGSLGENVMYALLGLAYASIGVAYLWFEGYASEQ